MIWLFAGCGYYHWIITAEFGVVNEMNPLYSTNSCRVGFDDDSETNKFQIKIIAKRIEICGLALVTFCSTTMMYDMWYYYNKPYRV